MNLSRRLLISFGAMLGLVLLLSAAAVVVTRDLGGELNHAANVTARRQYLAGQVSAGAADVTSLERGTVLAEVLGDTVHAEEYQRDLRERADGLRRAILDLSKMAETQEEAVRLRKLDEQAKLVWQAHDELRQAMANGQMDAGIEIFSQKVQPRLEEIGRQGRELVDRENRNLTAASAASASRRSRGIVVTVLLMLLAMVVGAGVFWTVRHASRALKDLASRMSQSAENVSGAAAQVSSASQSLASGASEQATSLEETSSSTEEIASITRKNAEHALEVAGLMQKSAEGAGGVNTSLDRMVEQMREIGNSSHKIARIIKVIDEIAFQTNILALNAAVEAARSGSAGAGFAVVADEVRSLAQRSARASKDTAEFVERNVTSADSALSRVGAVKSSWGQSGSIRDKVKAMSDEIARGSIEQDRDTQKIARSVAEVTSVTQRSASGAEELAAASEELNAQASLLSKLAERLDVLVGA
jgi:methyl-accepting chemotaxis protein/methyl-accepting chemotaxis protein-1 (serine sensor receptor)